MSKINYKVYTSCLGAELEYGMAEFFWEKFCDNVFCSGQVVSILSLQLRTTV